MENDTAVKTLSGLAQKSRLDIFRLLMVAGPEGLPVGRIGEAFGIGSGVLSFHLKELSHAGLVTSRREGRSIYYSANQTGIRDLLLYLVQDCCQGRPEICAPIRDVVEAACCAPNSEARTC